MRSGVPAPTCAACELYFVCTFVLFLCVRVRGLGRVWHHPQTEPGLGWRALPIIGATNKQPAWPVRAGASRVPRSMWQHSACHAAATAAALAVRRLRRRGQQRRRRRHQPHHRLLRPGAAITAACQMTMAVTMTRAACPSRSRGQPQGDRQRLPPLSHHPRRRRACHCRRRCRPRTRPHTQQLPRKHHRQYKSRQASSRRPQNRACAADCSVVVARTRTRARTHTCTQVHAQQPAARGNTR